MDLGNFQLKCGESIQLTQAYETYGKLNNKRDNVILICHSLTQSSHVSKHEKGDKKGWWEGLIGPGKYIDTNEYYVICINILGSCYGSTGPSSIDPKTGEKYGLDFPEISIDDMVKAQKQLLDELKIEKLKSIIGGSIGGQQALEWSKRYPHMVKSIVPIATGARVSPLMLGFGCISQSAIKSDPYWNEGAYYDKNNTPVFGLKIARQIGHLTYLSRESIEEKFGREKVNGRKDKNKDRFKIESYLDYQGDKFIDRFDPNSYLYITDAMHRYDLSEEYSSDKKAFKHFQGLVNIISIDSDWHFTVDESEYLSKVYEDAGNFVIHDVINSKYGHDGFLIEIDKIGRKVKLFLRYMFSGQFNTDII
ncbi:MAG: homoserine O-acetyltransferase MetX [Thermoplasmatota archaeon]